MASRFRQATSLTILLALLMIAGGAGCGDDEGEAVELEIAATLGKTDYEKADEYGMPVGAQATDFLISAADFEPTFSVPL